jgi:hypothetical protein
MKGVRAGGRGVRVGGGGEIGREMGIVVVRRMGRGCMGIGSIGMERR